MTEAPKFRIPIEVEQQLEGQPPAAEPDAEELRESSLRAQRLMAPTQAEAVRRHLPDHEIRNATRREFQDPVD
jgi:hypothetical protein